MGNTDSVNLHDARNKSEQRILAEALSAIQQDDAPKIQQMLQFDCDSTWLNTEVNEKGDTALMYAIRYGSSRVLKLLIERRCDIHAKNSLQETALSIAVGQYLQWAEMGNLRVISKKNIVLQLVQMGANGPPLSQLILKCMDNKDVVKSISSFIPNIHLPHNSKYAALLLQACVWYDHRQVARLLLWRGVDVQLYWDAPFMPAVTPNSPLGYQERTEEAPEGVEYTLGTPEENEAVQHTKLSLVHDWRHEWDEGATPEAAARAALQLPQEYLNMFIRASARQETIMLIAREISRYAPVGSGGPSVNSETFHLLVAEGYLFTEREQEWLSQKYQLPADTFSSPSQTLKKWCRDVIRRCAQSNMVVLAIGLPLPEAVKAYLLLGDVDSSGEVPWLLSDSPD